MTGLRRGATFGAPIGREAAALRHPGRRPLKKCRQDIADPAVTLQ
jgi:hypothetical protein